MSKREQILAELKLAKNLEHPYRYMRLTLECGHYKLSYACDVKGISIGFYTICKVCSENLSRLIVNEEETGILGKLECFES